MTAGTTNGALTTTNAATSFSNLQLAAWCSQNPPVNVSGGGLAATSYTSNGVLIGAGTTTPSLITGTNGQILIGGSGVAPVWTSIGSSDGSITWTPGTNTLSCDVTTATTGQVGGNQFATNAQAVTGSNTSLVICPASLTAVLAAPPSIGATTPNTAVFTTVTLNTTSGPTITTATGAPGGTAPKGSLYFRTNGTTTITRAYVNTTGSTVWTPLITVA